MVDLLNVTLKSQPKSKGSIDSSNCISKIPQDNELSIPRNNGYCSLLLVKSFLRPSIKAPNSRL